MQHCSGDVYLLLTTLYYHSAMQASIEVEDITDGNVISFRRMGHESPEIAIFRKLADLPDPALIVEINNVQTEIPWNEIDPDDIRLVS